MTPEQKLKEAKQQVWRKKEFYKHLTAYLAISIFLLVLNLLTSPAHWWFQWPVLGWGMAVLFNYFDVFGVPGLGPINKEWEQKAVEEELRKLEGKSGASPEELDLPPLRREEDWEENDLV